MDQKSYIFPEVAHFVSDLKNRGHIAVDTPELRLFVQEELIKSLSSDIDHAVTEEFMTTDQAEELRDLISEKDYQELEDQLHIVLPQYSVRVTEALESIKESITSK